MKSFEDKFWELDSLAVKIGYANLKLKESKLSDSEEKTVWYIIDAYGSYLQSRIDGECSLKASLDFDMEAEEKYVDEKLEILNKVKIKFAITN